MAIIARISGQVVSVSNPKNGDYIWVSLLQKIDNGRPELIEVGVLRSDDYGISEGITVTEWQVRIDADRKESGKLVAFYAPAR